MKKSRQIISLLLSILMITALFTAVPFTADAEEDNPAEVGAGELKIAKQPPEKAYIYSAGLSRLDVPWLSVAVTGGSGSYTYQWYCRSSEGGASSQISSASFDPMYEIHGNEGYYFCEVTDKNTGEVVRSNNCEVRYRTDGSDCYRPVEKLIVDGTKLIWPANLSEEVYESNGHPILGEYEISVWRRDKANDEVHHAGYFNTIRRSTGRTLVVNKDYVDSDVSSTYPCSYSRSNQSYTLDLKEFLSDDKNNSDIEYYFQICVHYNSDAYSDRIGTDDFIPASDLFNGYRTEIRYDNEVQLMDDCVYGDTVTANFYGGRWSGNYSGNVNIYWQRLGSDGKWADFGGPTYSNEYKTTAADANKYIRVRAVPKTTGRYEGSIYFAYESFYSNPIFVGKQEVPAGETIKATITKPEAGNVADFSFASYGNSFSSPDTSTTSGTGLTFFNVTEGQPVNKGQTFKYNTTYRASLYYKITKTDPAVEFVFADTTTVYINNTKAKVTFTDDKKGLCATMEFKTSEQKYVTVSFDANGGSGTMAPREARRGYSYTLPNCEFTAPAGKRFDCWLVNGERIRASKSFVANADTTAVAQWVDAPATINNIEIYLDKTPTADSLPCINASAPSGAGYYVYVDYKQPFYNNGVRWWGKKENRNLDPTTDRFVEGREYTVDICILTQDGFEFDVSSLTATLNGEQAIIPTDGGIYATANGAHVTYKFICTASELEAIPRIDVTVTAPKAGESPDFNVILPDDADYHIDAKYGVRWDIAATDVFTAGEQYNLWFYVIPDDGFYFDPDDDVIISVNGDEYEQNITSSTKFKTQVRYKFTAMGAAKIGDVNGDNNVDVLDAAIVQKYAAGKSTLTPEQIYAGDVNGDNNTDVLDAATIQKYAAGKITEFKKKA